MRRSWLTCHGRFRVRSTSRNIGAFATGGEASVPRVVAFSRCCVAGLVYVLLLLLCYTAIAQDRPPEIGYQPPLSPSALPPATSKPPSNPESPNAPPTDAGSSGGSSTGPISEPGVEPGPSFPHIPMRSLFPVPFPGTGVPPRKIDPSWLGINIVHNSPSLVPSPSPPQPSQSVSPFQQTAASYWQWTKGALGKYAATAARAAAIGAAWAWYKGGGKAMAIAAAAKALKSPVVVFTAITLTPRRIGQQTLPTPSPSPTPPRSPGEVH